MRYWWHAGKFVYMTFEQRRPRELRDAYRFPGFTPSRAEPSRAEPSRAEPSRAVRCGTQTRIPERLSSPCIAAYCQLESTVALGFVEGLTNRIREILRRCYGLRDEEYRRLKILTCTLPPLSRDHNAGTSPTRFNEEPKVFAGHPRAFAPIGGEAVRRTFERNCCTANQHECPPIARRDGSSYTTIPSMYLLVIRGPSRQSTVRLFDELLNETAIPRINANVRRSPGATDRRTRPTQITHTKTRRAYFSAALTASQYRSCASSDSAVSSTPSAVARASIAA